MPPSVGTARDFWHGGPGRHSGLAVPTISGICHPSIGTASDYWRARPGSYSALALPAIIGVHASDAPPQLTGVVKFTIGVAYGLFSE